MSNKRSVAYRLAFLVATSIFLLYWGRVLEYPIIANLNENLINLSAIVFGVMGAWLAVIYPDVLEKVGKSEAIGAGDEAAGRVKEIIHVTLVAVLSLSFSIVIFLLSPLINVWLENASIAPHVNSLIFWAIGVVHMVLIAMLLRTVRTAFRVLGPLKTVAKHSDAQAAAFGTESRKRK